MKKEAPKIQGAQLKRHPMKKEAPLKCKGLAKKTSNKKCTPKHTRAQLKRHPMKKRNP
jgi:hypothetical protein